MQVYALVGSSGTGKSYKAFMVASERGIDFIIDDGLLIGGTRVYAGTSAKRERTKIASVRRALFKEENHRATVKKVLEGTMTSREYLLRSLVKLRALRHHRSDRI